MKENSDLAAQIWDVVDRLLSGNYTVEEFRPKYEALYQGEEANNLSKEDEKIFSDISYKLDFTHFNPDPQSISDGYINYSQFIDWLREYRKLHRVPQ